MYICCLNSRNNKHKVSNELSEAISDFHPIARGSQVLICHSLSFPVIFRLQERENMSGLIDDGSDPMCLGVVVFSLHQGR